MICILLLDQDKEVQGWIIATDLRDARRQANVAAIGEGVESPAIKLLQWLVRHERTMPDPGKSVLPSGHVMLVT